MKKKLPPETSCEAFHSLDPTQLAEIYRKIISALSVLGEATSQETAAYLKIDHSRIWKRHSELEKTGLIYRPGNKRPLRSGRMGFTYMLTKEGLPTTMAHEKALTGKSIVDYSRKLITPNSSSTKSQSIN